MFFCHSDLRPVGCYRDSYIQPRPLPKLIADFRDDSQNASKKEDFNQTILSCAAETYKMNFRFFGLQADGECWSGEGSEKTYSRDGRSADCHHGVGKSGSNFVYRFSGECKGAFYLNVPTGLTTGSPTIASEAT